MAASRFVLSVKVVMAVNQRMRELGVGENTFWSLALELLEN